MELVEGALYKHIKSGGIYRYLYTALHTETEEMLAIYESVSYEYPLRFARPLEMFMDGRFEKYEKV